MLGVLLNDRYKIIEVIGEGGMATIYRCVDERLQRDVAVKILHPHLASDADLCRRFQLEASISARLESVNILKIFDVGTHSDGRAFIVSELLRGRNFHELQLDEMRERGAPFDPVFSAMVCEETLKGLAVAHAQGVVHRDVKPDNIVITNAGAVKLMDFGIAKNQGMNRTIVGHFLGSPCYSSPEQIQGEAVDHRSDLYSMGIILYEALSGTLPFDGQTPAEVMLKIVRGQYPALRRVRPGVPEELERLATRALDPRPQNRYESASSMANELRAYLGAKGIDDSRKGVENFLQRRRERLEQELRQSAKRPRVPEVGAVQARGGMPAQAVGAFVPQAASRALPAPPQPQRAVAAQGGAPYFPPQQGNNAGGARAQQAQLRRPNPPVPTPGQTRKFRRPVSIHRMAQQAQAQALAGRPTISRPASTSGGGGRWAGLALLTTLVLLGGMLAYVSILPPPGRGGPTLRDDGPSSVQAPRVRREPRSSETRAQEPAAARTALEAPVRSTEPRGGDQRPQEMKAETQSPPSSANDFTPNGQGTSASPPTQRSVPPRVPPARVSQRNTSATEKAMVPPRNAATPVAAPTGPGGAGAARLLIQTIPGGLDVYLDDDLLGGEGSDGTKGFEVKPGAHVLRVRGGEVNGVTYENFEKVVNFEAGKTVNLSPVRLRAVRTLSISIGGPGVVVKVDGETIPLRGRSADLKLPEGRHEIEARASNGRSFKRTIELRGENFTLNTSLE